MTDRLARALDDVRRRWVPDLRLGVFDVTMAKEGTTLAGSTTSREALADLRRIAGEAGLAVEVGLLPDASVDDDGRAIVTAAVAPLLGQPAVLALRVSEALHGEPLVLLERRGEWLHVRAADGYVAWIHSGYVRLGTEDWLEDWLSRATTRSLGCELEHQGTRLRLPIGCRLASSSRRGGAGQVETADGRLARVASGVVQPQPELEAEARATDASTLALRWFAGAPYAWGGRTEWGVDCSGLAQATYAARGVALPRDSDQQFTVGGEIPPAPAGEGYEKGDLLFFAERARVSHVALWAGAGRIVHSTLSRGGVVSEDFLADVPRLQRLRDQVVGVRRVES
ncbi:MAG TPA: C40 family peptidase [Gemmatimonadales bacterium]|nr:C40 family peptidase [Gemmatimonadales bacterium]